MQGPYRAEVVDNNDPDKACRVRAKIYDLFYDESTGETVTSQWLECMTGAGGGMGLVSIPAVGESIFVWVEPDDDDDAWSMCYSRGPALCDYTGSASDSSIPGIGRSLDDETCRLKGDVSATVPSTQSALKDNDGDKISESPDIILVELEAPETLNSGSYPDNQCFKTASGIVIELDDTEAANRIHIWHPSGTYLEMGHEGQLNQRQSKKWEETQGDCTHVTGGDEIKHVGGSQRTHIAGKRIEQVDGLYMSKARRLAFEGNTQISLNSLGTIAIMSDGVGKYDHAMGLNLSVGPATLTYSSIKVESVAGESTLALGDTMTVLTPTGISQSPTSPFINPTSPLFKIQVNPLAPAQVLKSSAGPPGARGVHLDIDAIPSTVPATGGETFIVNSPGAVSFTGGVIPSVLPATPLAKWNVGNVTGTGLELFLTTLLAYLATLEVKIIALNVAVTAAAAGTGNPAAIAAATVASTAVSATAAQVGVLTTQMGVLSTSGYTSAVRSQ